MHYDIPDEILQQHWAVLGTTGCGKTYTIKRPVERLLAAGRRVCVLDPTGAWWGLKSNAAGTGPGFPVVVFGGRHADVPLNGNDAAQMGEAIASLAAEVNAPPIVVDVSELLIDEQRTFGEAFAETIYRRNSGVLHLVIDEAHTFGPQTPPKGHERMLHRFQRLATGGRARGIRLVLASQRPAKVNKDLLGMAQAMVAMKVVAPQDREAIERWVEGQAEAKDIREVIHGLPRLKRGEGWIWCPAMELLKRVTFPPITTYDSSATPTDDAPRLSVTTAAIDMNALRARMTAAVAEAEANDPEKLRARIDELETKLRDNAPAEPAEPIDVDAIRSAAYSQGQAEASAKTADGLNRLRESMTIQIAEMLAESQNSVSEAPVVAHTTDPIPFAIPLAARSISTPTDRSSLSAPCRKILNSLAWWRMLGITEPTTTQVAAIAGYAVSGTFNNYLSQLSTSGHITRDRGSVFLTGLGERNAERPSTPRTLAALHDSVCATLDRPTAMILRVVLKHTMGLGHRPMTTEAIAKATNYAVSGTFNNYLSTLSSRGFIVRSRGNVTAAAILFPKGLK